MLTKSLVVHLEGIGLLKIVHMMLLMNIGSQNCGEVVEWLLIENLGCRCIA